MGKSVKRILVVCCLLMVSFNASAQATKVVVIPLGSDIAPLQNVITVSKENGDFSDPVEAMKSITHTDENNRYLVIIGPGVYPLTEALVMQEYVDISGSGRNATKLSGAVSTVSGGFQTDALVQGANNAGIRSLSIENTGGNTYSVGVYNGAASPAMTDMNIMASGGISNYGVYNDSSSPTMSDLSIVASGGNEYAYGVYNASSSPTMSNLNIAASEALVFNYGIRNASSSSSARIRNSSISGTTNSVAASTGSGAKETYIIGSNLAGPVAGDPLCASTFTSDGLRLSNVCAIMPPP